jgi:hypothetical protein
MQNLFYCLDTVIEKGVPFSGVEKQSLQDKGSAIGQKKL